MRSKYPNTQGPKNPKNTFRAIPAFGNLGPWVFGYFTMGYLFPTRLGYTARDVQNARFACSGADASVLTAQGEGDPAVDRRRERLCACGWSLFLDGGRSVETESGAGESLKAAGGGQGAER